MKVFHVLGLIAALGTIAACQSDPNAEPTYGEETGLPKNCRAIVQANIDGYRAKKHTADEVMASLERNCGLNGHAWGK